MPISIGNEPEGDPEVQAHDTIIQQLNRKIGEEYFPVESFENVSDWDSVPIIFAHEHPDLEAYDKDPVSELTRIAEKTGRRAEVVGTPRNTRIETKGRPRLMSELDWNADPDVQKLYDEGKLAISTGFWANTKDQALDGYVKPHHILLFEESETSQPRDKGVVVLNQETTKMKAFTNEGRVLSGKNQTRLNEIFASLKAFIEEITGGASEPEPEPKTNAETVDPAQSSEYQINKVKSALSKTLGLFWGDGSIREPWIQMTFPDSVIWKHPTTDETLKSVYSVQNGQYVFEPPVKVIQTFTEEAEQITNMAEVDTASKDAEIAELKALLQKEQDASKLLSDKIAEIEAASKEAAWQQLKNKLPPGMVHKAEDEQATRALFESDPVAFTNKLLEIRAEPAKGQNGAQFVNKDETPDENDPIALGRELRMSTGRMR